MKKTGILFGLSCLFLLIACSKDASPAPEPEPTPVDRRANLRGTGDSANDLLSNDTFTKLKIEIAYVTGFRPTVAAMNDFVTFVRQHTFKQDIELIYTELPSPEKESLSIQEIADLELENRTVYNEGETLGVYIYFADAPDDNDDLDEGLVTLGAVYRNTSMVIHEITVRRLAGLSAFITNADVESATVNHEFGHLFGLVDLGSPSVNDHEDTEAVNHCNVDGCLMKAELQFGPSARSASLAHKNESGLTPACAISGHSILRLLEARSAKGLAVAPELDSECILDLQANGGR